MRTYTKLYGSEFIRYFVEKNPAYTRAEAFYDISHTQFTYINQDTDPCNEGDDGEFNNCIGEFISSRMNCSLPWDVKNSSAMLENPLCSSKAEYDQFR